VVRRPHLRLQSILRAGPWGWVISKLGMQLPEYLKCKRRVPLQQLGELSMATLRLSEEHHSRRRSLFTCNRKHLQVVGGAPLSTQAPRRMGLQ